MFYTPDSCATVHAPAWLMVGAGRMVAKCHMRRGCVMTNISNSNRNLPTDPNQGAGGAMLGFAALIGFVFAGVSVASVFAASVFAGGAVLLVLGAIVLIAVMVAFKEQRLTPALVLLGLSALWAALGGAIVFDNHWLAFTPAAWVLNVLFVGALVAGAWAKLSGWLKALAALLALSLVTATALLPRPPGGEGPFDTAEKWKIDIEVANKAEGAPLADALVLCGTVMGWESALTLADTMARSTDRAGRVETWEFDEDPRLKIVICNAWKNANDGNAGYPAESQIVLAPVGGGEYRLHFALSENAHPETSFVTVEASGGFEQQNWYALVFEIWAGEPQGYFGAREGPQPLQRKSWSELRGGGFALPAADGQGDLQLRYHYEGPGGEGLVPPYNEVRTVPLGAVPGGARRRLDLVVPADRPGN